MFFLETTLREAYASSFDLGKLFRRPEVGIEFPNLSSDVIVQRPQPWTPSLRDLQLPHCLLFAQWLLISNATERKLITLASGEKCSQKIKKTKFRMCIWEREGDRFLTLFIYFCKYFMILFLQHWEKLRVWFQRKQQKVRAKGERER